MTNKERMHPLMIVFSFISQVKDLILPFAILIFGSIRNGHTKHLFLFGIPLILLVFLIIGIIKWFRFSYWIENEELRIEHGVFVSKQRFIPFERIQSIDSSANVIHRIFHLVKLNVETLGGGLGEAEVSLPAISESKAKALQQYIREAKSQTNEQIEEDEVKDLVQKVYKVPFRDLLIAGLTSSGIAAIVTILGPIYSQVDDLIPDHFYEKYMDAAVQRLIEQSVIFILMIVFVALMTAWILSVIGVLINYGGFTVVRTEKEIRISRGLLEKREVTIPIKRIQGLLLEESLLRQPFGLMTLRLQCISSGEKDEMLSRIFLPIIHRKQADAFLLDMLPEFKVAYELQPLPKRALRRSLFRHLFFPVIVAVLLTYFVSFGKFALILLPFFALQGYYVYKDAGFAIVHPFCILRRRHLFNRTTAIIRHSKIQKASIKQTIFQKKKQLATFMVNIPLGEFKVKDIEEKDSLNLMEWFIKSYEERVRRV